MLSFKMLRTLTIKTNKKQEIIDITEKVKSIVSESRIKEGFCIIFTPHSTAGIIINENYDKNLCYDILDKLEEFIPVYENYRHNKIDNNAHAHIKASLIGPTKTAIIKNGQLLLGTWQGIALAEFDGPRVRNIFIKIIKEKIE